MYVVAIFALALLSPLPFVSPFVYDVQDVEAQSSPFGTGDPNNPDLQNQSTSDIATNVDPSKITLTSISDNANQAYAIAGDTITVTFTAEEILHYNSTATIHGKNASISSFNNTINASITVLETDPDGYANFEINVSSNFGVISVSEADLTNGNAVFVDKHVPVIKINGPTLVYVTQNDAYTEFGASVKDADPNYSNGNLAIDSSSVDVTTVGTYTVEYTADADGAGNEPFSKTRKVSVQSSSPIVSVEASYVDTETILLQFDTPAPAFYSRPADLTSAITVDNEAITSAFISGQVKSIKTLDSSVPTIDFLVPLSQFGQSLANMGDLNQDGYDDILVGIPLHISSSTNSGGAFAILHLGENAESILDVFVFDADSPNMPFLNERYLDSISGEPVRASAFGHSVENVGDINGDGFADIVVGAPTRVFDRIPGATTGSAFGGAYTIFLGPNGSSVLGYAEINHTLPDGPRPFINGQFGHSILNMGDLNNDGINDIAVTAPETKDASDNIRGAVYVMHLGSDGLPIKTININLSVIQQQFPSFNPPIDSMTWAIENMGDLNGDGYTDMMMATVHNVDGNSSAGYEYEANNYLYTLHLGENGESIVDINQIPMHGENMPPGTGITGTVNYGETIKKLEDINGDGYTDLLLAAPDYLDKYNTTKGALFVILLNEDGTSPVGHYEITSDTLVDVISGDFRFQNNSRVGTGITVLGDLDSDGGLEIMVSATKYVGVTRDRSPLGQGALHVFSLAGSDDRVPHVVIKPNTIADTDQTAVVELDPILGKLQLLSLSDSDFTATASDNIPPEVSDVTTLTNTSLRIEFSEDIEEDTDFGVNSFRVSGTDEHVSVTNAKVSGSNTVLLNVTRISGLDEPLVEIFDSAIKDNNGNVVEYAEYVARNLIGTYPLNAFWIQNYQDPLNTPLLGILFENSVQVTQGTFEYYKIGGISSTAIGLELGFDKYHSVRYFVSPFGTDPPLTFAYNDTGIQVVLAPKESFLDVNGDAFSQNYTLDVETVQPPKILYAETSEGRYITLTMNRYVTGVETTDFSLSDSLSVQGVDVDANKIILNVSSMQSDATPTVTIIGSISDSNPAAWANYVNQEIEIGDNIIAIDGSNPVVTKVEYDNVYDVTVYYSEPIDESTLDLDDFKIYYEVERTFSSLIEGVTVKKITNIDTASDGLSSVLTFDRQLNTLARLLMVGSIHDKTGSAMPYTDEPLLDTISPTISSAKTIDTTSIEIQFTEDLDPSSVSSTDFTISDNIVVNGVSVLDDLVVLTTSTIQEDATPTVTIVDNISDIAGNSENSASIVAVDEITPSLASLSIISDNTNIGLAKSGDDVTLALVANEPVSFVSGTILEITPQIDEQDNTINATVTIATTTSNGQPTFTITIVDDAGNEKNVTQFDITGTNVDIDTLAPIITLNGLDTTILTIGKTYTDEGTVVIDNDPSYAHTSATITSNTINNNQLGSYEVTYSAQPDSAGNVPVTKIRNVTIVDTDPITITSLSITSFLGNSFANENDTITVALETDGTDLGNFTGTLLGRDIVKGDVSSGSTTFTTTVLDNDTNGDAMFSITVTNSSGNEIVITNNEITDGTSVTIDTIKPVISLTGSQTDTVLQGNSYTDPGASVSDLNYPSSPQTVTALPANLATSSLGPQDITYSAPDDPAGNTPDSITRTVNVLAKPLGIDALTITSNNNVNTSYAKDNDVITLRLDANGTLGSSTTVSIASNTVAHTLANDILTVSYTVESSLGDTTSLPFIISANNEDNLQTRTFTQADLSGSSIIIDNTAPTITLQGDDPLVFYTSRSSSNPEFVDPGADAYDLSYETLRINATNTPDISVPGTFTLNYKAPDDLAGNTGPTVTRALTVQDAPSISITSLTILTATGNSAYAKAGDEIFLTLTVNDTIVSHNTQILGAAPHSATIDTNTLRINAITPNDGTELNATFTITVENAIGATLTVTENDLLGSNVFVDTLSPRIELVGAADYFVIKDTTNPIIPNVTITENDPNYSNTFTLTTPDGIVDATVNGSVYNYTYTAAADTAGNLGDSVSRTITVIDADPITITSLSIASSPGNTNLANAGKIITVTLETDGTDLGNFTGTLLGRDIVKGDVTSGSTTFTTTVLDNDTNGDATFSITVTNSSGNRIIITNTDITDSSYVTIDTVKPVITLYGISPDTVLQGNSYTDLGATATDLNNPSYEQLATASTLATSSLGPQNITYSAPADPAGNTPDSITRTVNVLAKPLGIDALTITSNNANSSYAKANDVITLRLEANGTIGSSTTVSIASNTVAHTLANDILTVSYTVESSLGDTTSLPFIISASNEDNLQTRTFTQVNLPGSSIIIDNTAPSITLNGNNNTIVATNSSYTDSGATASDTSYAGDIQITGTGNVDIAQSGNYTVTYTAPADAAGNLAPSIIRIVSVVDLPPIDLTALTITSASSGKYVKAGDTLFLTLTLNDTIVSHNSQILGASITSNSISTNILYLQAVISNDVTESYAEFTVMVTNDDEVTLTVTEDDLSDLGQTNVFIDTVSPSLTLINGPANYSIVNGTMNPIIRNVTAHDGDPNYLETYTLTQNATVDASVNGSVYNYTYTAVADTAGNLGESISRIITIIDADPITITSLSIASSSGNSFANAGKTITVTLETDGTDLGNFTGTLLGRDIVKGDVSSGSTTFTTAVLDNDTDGDATFSITVTNSSGNRIFITNNDVTDSSYVTIDTTKPVITLYGISPDTVLQGNSYTDLGATATDLNNPSYEQLATASTLATSSLGPQDITYSAPDDPAGNTPDSITRTVTVLAKPLNITTLTITSNNNVNTSYAKAGDVITLRLEANGTIGSSTTVSIASTTPTPTITGQSLTASYTVESSLVDTTSLAFTITTYNEDNLQIVTSTQADLAGSSIIIDNTVPSITLNGNNNTIVATNNAYTDPGATASDSSYAGDIQVTGTGNVDITQSGNYTVTYTAPADAAGNLAPSIIRIVSVVDLPPIDITSLTITSSSSGKYVKASDTLFLTLVLNDTIVSHNSQILGASITSNSISSETLYLQAVISNDVIESYAEFNIAVTNDDGVTLTVTEDDLNDLNQTNVFIDTVSPRLTLIDGPANYSIINGTMNPIIRNVTAHDGDPNYLETYTLTTNATVNADVNGSVYNYTYTAVADTAGNLGESISRIITIIDALPIDVTSLSITSSPGNPNFAKADDTITLVLRTDSNDLGSITGTLLGREFTSTINGGSATFTTTVFSNDTNGNVTFSIEATNSSDGRVAISESGITDGSFVTIDTILPVITLNGENNTIVAVGADYTDPSATVADQGNPSYAGTITARPATVDTSSSGNKTITYTAPADAAGNVPDSIIRIVAVEDAPPIEITLFTIRNGGDSSSLYARGGDDLSIQLSINYTIASYTATIFGIEQSESNQNSNGFLISQQVPYDLAIEEYASFSITIVDEKGLPNTITENTKITSTDMPPNNIFIDTISPTIELTTKPAFISVNETLPKITAIVNDGDPKYNSTEFIIPDSIVNASVNNRTAEVYPFTYTAPPDTAGNPGQNATINIIVKNINQTGTTILNSSIITNKSQTFTDVKSIIAEIHTDTNPNNTLSLDAPTLELDVSNITVTKTIDNTVVHTTTYPHSLDLTVKFGLSVQIEPNVTMEFTPDTSLNSSNFTVRYVDDGPNPDTIQLGLYNTSYTLIGSALGIAFEGVSSSYKVYIREDPNENYELINTYNDTVVTNGTNASLILDQNPTYYRGVMYTYDPNLRIGTVWTLHLSNLTGNDTSSGGDESSSNSPTLGKTSSGAQLVTNGFQYNGLTVNVDRYHTEFPLIGTNVGDINTISMKIYDSAGPSGIKRVEFALGVPDIGLYHEAEAFVEVWMQRDSVAVQETIIVDELNLLENSDVSATVSQTSCSGGEQQCLLVELQYSYREPPAYNTISIKPVDWDNNAHQFYFNDGIHVDGDSINLPKEITISASHAADTTHAGETLHLVQIDRAEHLWVDQYGYQWMIIGNTVRQITVPEYLVPDDNTYGTLHGPDRNHPEFASSVYAEQQKAQETLAEILGHATILKPLPENGGTIYFDATGTDSRSGDSFKLLLELETARMHQLSNLLYDDTS